MIITLDFETRSYAELKRVGAWVYSEHPTTEPICLWFGLAPNRTFRWLPGDPEPPWLRKAIDGGATFEAHNVLFERGMWENVMVRRYGWPPIPADQWFDTQALCGRRALPLDLLDAGRLLKLPVEKDYDGHQAMLKLCKPTGKKKEYNEDPVLREKVIEYCRTDVLAEMSLRRRLGSLEPREHAIWTLNQRMNMRGLAVDLSLVRDCQTVVDTALPTIGEAFHKIVGCRGSQRDKVLKWVRARLGKDAVPNLKGETVDHILKDETLPADVRRALILRKALTASSIAKLDAMRRCTGSDGRARGLIQYHAATTGRDGGRLLQPQNFPRGSVEFGKDEDGRTVEPWDVLVSAIQTRDPDFVRMVLPADDKDPEIAHLVAPIAAVSSALRHCLVAGPGKTFVSGDLSTIELRVVLALAGQRDKLKMIADGADPYSDMASRIYGRPINKHDNPKERQVGKAAVLGLGFQMGVKKFHGKELRDQSVDFAKRIVDTYRYEWAPLVPDLWAGLEEASMKTVMNGRAYEYNGLRYELQDEWLTCLLPSGRKLYYFRPRKAQIEMPWSTPEDPDIRLGWTYLAKKGGRLRTVAAYGGLLAENVTQGLARDIMYDRLLVAEAEGYPLVLTVHDEGVTECDEGSTFDGGFKQIMEEAPPYAAALGIKLATEGWADKRYHK